MATVKKANRPGQNKNEEKAEKVKVEKVNHPALKDGPLKSLPDDFNSKKHNPLKKKDFAEEHLFFDWRASHLEKQAAKMRAAAEESRQLGSLQDRAKAKRLLAMQKRMAEMMEDFKAQGVDVDALLAAATKKDEE